jgi:membrane protein required for colicin V production
MNIFDLILALLIGWAILMGVRKGLVIQATAVVALLLGIYAAYKFSYILAEKISGIDEITGVLNEGGPAVYIISFLLTFIAVVVAARLLGSIVDRIFRLALLGWLNRLLGVVFAVIKMMLIVSVVLYILNSIDRQLPFMPKEWLHKSKFYKPVSSLAPTVLSFLDIDKVKKSAKNLNEKVEKKVESVR